ncbi:MAG: hypothetical protein HQK65_10060 [Desulfamplus sp.]|nr:hypothetical protein [Desulfamplus sp.]
MELRKRLKEKIEAKKRQKSRYVSPKPRYDEVFFEGITLLNEMGRAPEIEGTYGIIEFADDIWKSDMRRVADDL